MKKPGRKKVIWGKRKGGRNGRELRLVFPPKGEVGSRRAKTEGEEA